MSRNHALKDQRDAAILTRFNKLSDSKTKAGKMKYSYDFIYEKLSEEFFLSVHVITQVVASKYRRRAKRKAK